MVEKKVKLRMGMHNRITAERFHVIKEAIADGMAGPTIEKKYNIKHTTLSYIRRAKTYYQYRLLTEGVPRVKKMPKVYGQKSGLPFEDYGCTPIFFSIKKVKPTDEPNRSRSNSSEAEYAKTMLLLLGACIFAVLALSLIAVGV